MAFADVQNCFEETVFYWHILYKLNINMRENRAG